MTQQFNYDNLQNIVEQLTRDLQYTQRRTRDNSHLVTNQLQKDINEIEKKFQDTLNELDEGFKKNIASLKDSSEEYAKEIKKWTNAGGRKKYEKQQQKSYYDEQKQRLKEIGKTDAEASSIASKLAKSYGNQLRENNLRIINAYSEIANTIEKKSQELAKSKFDAKINRNIALYNKKEQNTSDAWNAVTGGRYGRIKGKADEMKSFGAGLEFLGGGKGGGVMAKLGRDIRANTIKGEKFAGKLSIATMAAEQFGQVVIDTINFINTQLKLTAQQSQTDFELLTKETEIKGQKASAELEYNSQILQKQAEGGINYISSLAKAELQRYTGAVDSKITSFTDITGGAYKALDTEISYKYAKQKAELEKSFAIGEENSSLAILKEKAGVKQSETMNVLEGQGEIANVQRARASERIHNERIASFAEAGGAIIGGAAGAVGSAVATGGTLTVLGAVEGAAAGAAIGKGVSRAVTELYASTQDWYYQQQEQGKQFELQNKQVHQQYMNQSQEAISSIKEMGLNAVKEVSNVALEAQESEEKAWANLTAEIDKKWEIAENSANEIGISFGYLGQQMDDFKNHMFNTQVSVSKWGKKMEDLQKLQENYSLETGRNIQLSNGDFNSSFAMGTFWGEDTVSALDSGMEYFNHSVKDSNEMFFEMHKSVLKMGLSSKKFGKDLVNNLKLAEKYNFKNGVKGLMDMAKWAQNMRFNTASLDGMLDKVQDGGLEGIIKQAAELQVLGGNFAMGSDPLAMAYESYMDPEGYAKRMNGMLAGQGYLKENGEVGFGITSQQIMRQYAKSTGQDYKDVLKQATQQYKISAIQSSLNPSQKFNEDQQSMIANKAQFIDGEWKVNTGLKDAQNNEIFKNVNDITPEDLKLMIDDSEKTLEQSALESLSIQRRQEAVQNLIQSDLMNNYDNFKTEHLQRIETVFDDYQNNRTTYQVKVDSYLKGATDSLKKVSDYYVKNSPQDIANKFSSTINGTLNTIKGQLTAIIQAIGAKYDITGKDVDAVGGSHSLLRVKKMMDEMEKDKSGSALTNISNTNSKWYTDPTMVAVMDTLRADPRALKEVKDKNLQKKLAQLIFKWDDEGSTTDFDYHHDADLIEIMKSAVGDKYDEGNNWINFNGGGTKGLNDGFINQNGTVVGIDNNDQVLAAKNGGPIDKMLDSFQNSSNVMPRPMPYNSFVSSSVGGMSGGMGGNNSINIPPIQININGSIQLNGSGSVDITQQLSNDPNFIRSISQIISVEVEKKVNGGKTINTLNRNLSW